MDEDRYYLDDEFIIDRHDGSVRYDDMRGRAGQIVAELLNYVEAMEADKERAIASARKDAIEEARRQIGYCCSHCHCTCVDCAPCGSE